LDTTAAVVNALPQSHDDFDAEACLPSGGKQQLQQQQQARPHRGKGSLRVVNPDAPASSPPGNPRLPAVATDYYPQETNRNSQASAATTDTSPKSRRKTHVGPWLLGMDLGVGSTARVRKARHAVTGQLAAIKIISKTVATGTSLQKVSSLHHLAMAGAHGSDEDRRLPLGIEREVVIMKLLEHPNVISLYDVWENRGEL
jgi:hypothetical protein